MNVKRCYLILFISIFCLVVTKPSHAQTTEDIIGKWKVVKVELLPGSNAEETNGLQTMNKMFLQAMFNVNNDRSFSLTTTSKDLTITTATWRYNSTTKTITVTGTAPDTKTEGLLMGIIVSIVDGNYLFKIEETPVILTVSKT